MSDRSVALREWETRSPSADPALAGFRFANSDDRALARRLAEQGKLELVEMHDGLRVSTRSHVGRVRLGELTITIQPKLGPDELLSLFRYAFGLRHTMRFDPVGYSTSGLLFADLLIAQLHAETRTLVERGIARAYVRMSETLPSPRGQVRFGELARRGGMIRADLPCTHHPRSSDNVLNQVLVAGLELAMSMASNRRLRASVAQQHGLLATLASPVRLSSRLLDRAARSVDRLTSRYASILELVGALYAGTLLDLSRPPEGPALGGFLFDMNAFWQRVLDRFLRENLDPLRVESEHGLTSMMRFVPGQNPKRRRDPTPRPDYAIRDGRKIIALLDAKYRDLWERSLPREMLYQLAIYALSQPAGSTAAILFPTTDVGAKPSRIEIRDPLTRTATGYVALRPVVLSRLVRLLDDVGEDARRTRGRFARELALGDAGLAASEA